VNYFRIILLFPGYYADCPLFLIVNFYYHVLLGWGTDYNSIAMATTLGDFKIASLAAGFTLGFGFLTVWTAIKQTTRQRTPWQSTYVWMIWGEIAANLGIGILGWLFLEGVVPTG
jgi:hypothetical protein